MLKLLPSTKALLFLAVIACSTSVFGQTKERIPCVDKTFSVVAHIFKDTFGLTTITEPEILEIFKKVNLDFAPICVSFEVCEFQYHDNYQYDMHERPLDWQEMQNLYHVNKRVNFYYVKNINVPAATCGYAGLAGIGDLFDNGIVIQKTGSCCGITSKTHSHELGHYFGLEHTFMDGGTNELVDGSNCATAGDGICDTPADPFDNASAVSAWVNNCRFINTGKDANNEYYDPIVGNIMSYYPDECACGFTDDQFRKMAATYLSQIGQW